MLRNTKLMSQQLVDLILIGSIEHRSRFDPNWFDPLDPPRPATRVLCAGLGAISAKYI